jgi:ribosomal protein L37AE/L43A
MGSQIMRGNPDMDRCPKCGTIKIARVDVNDKGIKYTAWFCNQCNKTYGESFSAGKNNHVCS